jgi:predicted homoserine dehydrogenase-like protein
LRSYKKNRDGVQMDLSAAEVMATAKRNMKPGDRLDGFSGNSFLGQMDRAETSAAPGALSVGFVSGALIACPITEGDVISWDDVHLDENQLLGKFHRQQDSTILR